MEKIAVAAKRGIVLALCGYECAAIASGRAPTITTLCTRHRWLAPVVITALAVHLAWNPPQQTSEPLALPPGSGFR